MKETKKARDERTKRILEKLDKEYGTDRRCFLNYGKDYELLFAVILSAQCTDARVNIVTETLFKKYPTLEAWAQADPKELEEDVRPTGFYHNKAQNIRKCAGQLIEKFGGKVPSETDELTSLAGVGRKTANVIRNQLFGLPGIAVDTHVKRISGRLGLTENTDPVRIEYDLMEILPEDHRGLWNTDIITLGRTVCISGREKCGECFLSDECPRKGLHI